jgi:ribosomal protein L19E
MRTYVRYVARVSALPESRLDALYESAGFGGEKTMRAKVIRELIDEIRALRRDLESMKAGESRRH